MTLTTPYSATFIIGDGETKTFSYLFEEVSESFISVMVYNTLTGLTSTPTYTVDTDQKQVIFGDDTSAPTADEVVCIYRDTPEIQDVSFRTLQGYDAKSLENILSKIVAMIQELKSNYFSTQVLQGDPWQLDLLTSADDGATVNIDYTAKKLVKGLCFRITSGNLQVSADGSNYITMPKSSDVAEFRQQQTELPDHTYQYKLQYRVGSTWYDADVTAQNTADAAYSLASTVQADLSSHTNNQNNPHQTSVAKLTDTAINNPTLGHFLRFDGTKWVNSSSDVTSVDWGEIEGDITDQTDLQSALGAKVNIDGTSIMTAPLKFMSGSVRGAVGPYFNGVGFWKLDSHGNLTQIASISDSQFIPTTTETIDLGNSTKKWENLYLGGKVYVATINNGYDISVPAYTGTMVVADSTGATAGQLLLLDSNLKPVWGETSTYLTYPAGWTTTGTTKAFCDDIAADSSAVAGKAYLGEVTISDLPSGLVNAEIEVKIMDGTTAANKVILLTLTSGNVAPYQWQYTYWNGGSDTSGWIGFQPELPSQIGNSGKFLTTNGSNLSWATVDALPSQTGHAGEYLTTDGTDASWAAINVGSSYHPDLFDWKWADHILNDVQWLRADTFSWQSGAVYEAAYWDLFYDIQISTYWYLADVGPAYTKSRTPAVGDAVYLNSDLTGQIGTVATYDDVNDAITVGVHTYTFMSNTYVTPTTETVAGYTLTVYTGHSGKKIVGQVDEADVASIYNATGVAWYYVIDLNNKRFKLPRTKFGMTGLRDTVGNYVAESLPNITGNAFPRDAYTGYAVSDDCFNGCFKKGTAGKSYYPSNSGASNAGALGFDASGSSSAYQDDAPVQQRATQMYLYFYVGSFTQTAIENTAGLNASLFNGKADTDLGNVSAGIDFVVESQLPTAGNNYTWYRKYKSGWVEQGGQVLNLAAGQATSAVVFPVEFSDSNYTLTFGTFGSGFNAGEANFRCTVYSATGATFYNNSGSVTTYKWYACGMAA